MKKKLKWIFGSALALILLTAGGFWLRWYFVPPLLEPPTLEVFSNGERMDIFFDYVGFDKPLNTFLSVWPAPNTVEAGSVLEFRFNSPPNDIYISVESLCPIRRFYTESVASRIQA